MCVRALWIQDIKCDSVYGQAHVCHFVFASVYQCMRSEPSDSNHQAPYFREPPSYLYFPLALLSSLPFIFHLHRKAHTSHFLNPLEIWQNGLIQIHDAFLLRDSQTRNCKNIKRLQIKVRWNLHVNDRSHFFFREINCIEPEELPICFASVPPIILVDWYSMEMYSTATSQTKTYTSLSRVAARIKKQMFPGWSTVSEH